MTDALVVTTVAAVCANVRGLDYAPYGPTAMITMLSSSARYLLS